MTAHEKLGAALDGVLDQRVDLGPRVLVDQRPDLGARLEAGGDLEPLDRLEERRNEAVGDPALDVNPIGADA